MKRGKQIDTWYPMFIDKWLFGSTRHELIIQDGDHWLDLRGIFTDLMTLSKKDGGFIRANETTPYPIAQLAGMFCVPEIHLKKCIELCLKYDKLTEVSTGIYYIKNTETYALTDRHKRRMSEKTDMMSENADPRLKEIRGEDRKEEKIKHTPSAGADALVDPILAEFEVGFWQAYPVKHRKQDALKAYRAVRKVAAEAEILAGYNGYMNHLKDERVRRNFEKSPMHAATFLRSDRWREFVGFQYKPRL